jgi:hypothetical protein
MDAQQQRKVDATLVAEANANVSFPSFSFPKCLLSISRQRVSTTLLPLSSFLTRATQKMSPVMAQ